MKFHKLQGFAEVRIYDNSADGSTKSLLEGLYGADLTSHRISYVPAPPPFSSQASLAQALSAACHYSSCATGRPVHSWAVHQRGVAAAAKCVHGEWFTQERGNVMCLRCCLADAFVADAGHVR